MCADDVGQLPLRCYVEVRGGTCCPCCNCVDWRTWQVQAPLTAVERHFAAMQRPCIEQPCCSHHGSLPSTCRSWRAASRFPALRTLASLQQPDSRRPAGGSCSRQAERLKADAAAGALGGRAASAELLSLGTPLGGQRQLGSRGGGRAGKLKVAVDVDEGAPRSARLRPAPLRSSGWQTRVAMNSSRRRVMRCPTADMLHCGTDWDALFAQRPKGTHLRAALPPQCWAASFTASTSSWLRWRASISTCQTTLPTTLPRWGAGVPCRSGL